MGSESRPQEAVLELLENHVAEEAPEPTGSLHAVAFISQNELTTALGYVFGGIAARCQETPALAKQGASLPVEKHGSKGPRKREPTKKESRKATKKKSP